MLFRRSPRPAGRSRSSGLGRPAATIEGLDPLGHPVSIDPEGRTIFFLTSSCAPCRPVWASLPGGSAVVTPDSSTESRRKVAELAPEGVPVVMSSATWFAYGAGPAPWRVAVAGGVVASEGPAGDV